MWVVLREQVEVFAEGTGKLRHLFAAMVGRSGGVALSLFDAPVHLKHMTRTQGGTQSHTHYNPHWKSSDMSMSKCFNHRVHPAFRRGQ